MPASDIRMSCLLYSVGIDDSHYQETLDLGMLQLTIRIKYFRESFNKHLAADHLACMETPLMFAVHNLKYQQYHLFAEKFCFYSIKVRGQC